MDIRLLDENQSRILINACQGYESFRETLHDAIAYKGGMHWKKAKGKEYLFKSRGGHGAGQSLGVRSPETEKIYKNFHRKKKEITERFNASKAKVMEQSRFNKAAKIHRVPKLSAKILRLLDQQNFLGNNVMVVGTNAIYAYEAAAGVQFDEKYIATEDIDFLWDSRKTVKLAIKEDGKLEDFLSTIKKADRTFQIKKKEPFRATNKENFMVDLIRTIPSATEKQQNSIGGPDDLIPAEIMNLTWLLSAPKFEHIAIGSDGFPVRIVAPDPRAFALHKFWISQQFDRGRTKGRRDLAQALGVARLTLEYLPMLEFSKDQLKMFPEELVDDFKNALCEDEMDNDPFSLT